MRRSKGGRRRKRIVEGAFTEVKSSTFNELIPGPLLPTCETILEELTDDSIFMEKYKTRTNVLTPQFGKVSIGEGLLLV